MWTNESMQIIMGIDLPGIDPCASYSIMDDKAPRSSSYLHGLFFFFPFFFFLCVRRKREDSSFLGIQRKSRAFFEEIV